MKAAAILRQAAQHGVSLRLVDGVVRMQADAPPPPALLDELRRYRDLIVTVLEKQQEADALVHAAEQEAMRAHYAARAGPELPPCTMKAGLIKGYFDHLHIMKRD